MGFSVHSQPSLTLFWNNQVTEIPLKKQSRDFLIVSHLLLPILHQLNRKFVASYLGSPGISPPLEVKSGL